MSNFFWLFFWIAGLLSAGFFSANNYGFEYIFIASALMSIGFIIVKWGLVRAILTSRFEGIKNFTQLIIKSYILWTIQTALIYIFIKLIIKIM